MSRVYLDASCIIYLIESASPFHDKVVARLTEYRTDIDASVVTSLLSRLECRTRPLRDGDAQLLAEYETFFVANRLALSEISAAVIERATDLRARYGFKTPDAIHVATAIESGAGVMLTGDSALRRCTELRVEVLEP